jgi:gamma-glutamyltranspeptidase/glutathione hydrolase
MTFPRPVSLRAPVLGVRGAVTSSHPAVSGVGAHVLADGGNAFDATLAMTAMGWMVLPGQCGIGGDAFVLVRDADGRVWTMNGSGYGPDGGTPEVYRARGHSALPVTGPLSVAVPGAPGVLARLAELATRALPDLWAPALAAAREGVPCTEKTRADIAGNVAVLAADPGARAAFLPGGRIPAVGERMRQPALAATLDRLAVDLRVFHTGWFAERAVASLAAAGAPFSGDEWRLGAEVVPQTALTTPYGGRVLHETPLPSAGWMVIHQALLLDGQLGARPQLGVEAVHWLAEAARESFQHRFESVGADGHGWHDALRPSAVVEGRRRIASGERRRSPGVVAAGDTTSTVCVDADGTAVSFIHSLAHTFGSGVSVPGTGVLLDNRLGRGAYLIDGHPNEVRPRRKPMHTLNAWLLTDDDGLVAAGNCPGGDGQVQWNMQVLSHLVDHGDDPQRAVSLPRVSVFPGSDADTLATAPVLRCEDGLDPDVLDDLARRGHRVERVPVQRGGPGGSALVIAQDREHGVLVAAADPRMDGVALAV